MRDQELKSREGEEGQRERLGKLENMVLAQNAKLDKLEDLVYRVMHHDRVGVEEEEVKRDERPNNGTPGQNDIPPEVPVTAENDSYRSISKPDRTKPYYSISSV